MTEEQRTMVQASLGLSALVLDSPHSGRWLPPDFRPACPERALREAEDVDVHLLWQDAITLGASLVQARFLRTYIDVNRAADEIDAGLLSAPWPGPMRETAKVRLGKGLVWRMLDDGTRIYDRLLTPDEMNQRIERCWVPYHRALDQAIEVAHRRHGHVIHLNCHSMPAVAQAYSTEHPFLHHADFVLGDRDGSSADPRLTRWMERFLNSRGYTVSINHPYKGVEIVRRHGRPAEGRHSVQVEVNKRLYMSEETLERHAGFEQVRQTLRELAEALLVQDLGLEGGSPPPVAPAAAYFAK